MKMTEGNKRLPSGHKSFTATVTWGKEQNSSAGKEGTSWFPFQLWAYDWRIQTCLSAACGFDPGLKKQKKQKKTKTKYIQISFSASTGIFLCFPVVPARICRGVRLYGPLGWRAGVLWRFLSLRGARVQQRKRFVGVEGPAVVLRPRWARCWPVLRHPPEVLERAFPSLVVVGTEFITTSSFGVRMPEIWFIPACFKPVVWHNTSLMLKQRTDLTLTCRNTVCDLCGLGHCCTGRTAFFEGSCCCGNCSSCGTSLRVNADRRSGPCSDAGRRDDVGLPAMTGCCYLGSCIYGPFASRPYLWWNA